MAVDGPKVIAENKEKQHIMIKDILTIDFISIPPFHQLKQSILLLIRFYHASIDSPCDEDVPSFVLSNRGVFHHLLLFLSLHLPPKPTMQKKDLTHHLLSCQDSMEADAGIPSHKF